MTANARGTNGFRQSFDGQGLSLGQPGNGMNFITIVADADVIYTGLTGEDRTLLNFSTGALHQTLLDGVFQETGIVMPTTMGAVDIADVAVTAGQVFTFAFDYTARAGFSTIYSQSVLKGLEFETTAPPIPLPAGLPLLLTGLVGFGLLRRRKT